MITVPGEGGDENVKVAVLVSGRGSNFEALCREETGRGVVSLLITDNPNAPALEKAGKLGVEGMYLFPGEYRTRFDPVHEERWAAAMKERGIGLVCLAGLMRILKGPILREFSGSVMNIHPSLLPSFPGLDAQGQALEYGVKVTGCTVHYVDEGVDTGPVILQRTVPVFDDDDRESLSARILEQEHVAYPMAVKLHCAGRLSVKGRKVVTSPAERSAGGILLASNEEEL